MTACSAVCAFCSGLVILGSGLVSEEKSGIKGELRYVLHIIKRHVYLNNGMEEWLML